MEVDIGESEPLTTTMRELAHTLRDNNKQAHLYEIGHSQYGHYFSVNPDVGVYQGFAGL